MDEDDGDEFDSFDDENLDELILLTAKTPRTQQQQKKSLPQTQSNVHTSDINLQLQSAQGENAILRSKLELLEKQKLQDLQKLKEQFSNDLNDKVSKIQAYQELTVKLEDEKKFLKSELTSLSTRSKPTKRRKLDSQVIRNKTVEGTEANGDDDDDVVMIDTSNTATTTQSIALQTQVQVKVIHHQSLMIPNEKQLFIETIYNYVINGASKSTIGFLIKIASPITFTHEDFHVEVNNDISTSILNYLIQLNNNIRLDNLISEFIEILTIYIQKLYLKEFLLPIPWLLSLVYCSLNYRPSALHNDIIEQLLQFNSDFLKNYLYILKSPNGTGGQEQQRQQERKKNLQYIILDQFIVLFSLDIIELLSKLSYTKQDVIKMFWKLLPKDIIKSGLSNSTCINCVFNMVEILTYSITSIVDDEEDQFANDEEESFVKDDDILLSMTKLLIEGMPLTEGLRIYGLNRIIGNNDDLQLLEKLVTANDARCIKKALPVLSSDIIPVSLNNELKHELHTLNLKLKILRFFETFLMNNSISSLKFEFIVELLKILIWVLLKQQEYIIRNPRSETVNLRNLMINSIVKLIHFIVLKNDEIPQDLILQKLSNDISYNFIIALTRISFSSDTNLNLLAMDFLKTIDKDFEIPIFNKFIESTNYLQNNLSTSSPLNIKLLSVLNNNNGLEISFDDDTIEMSRDLIELYTTLIELDNLYFAMNKAVESNELDELMMEYMNDNNNNDNNDDKR